VRGSTTAWPSVFALPSEKRDSASSFLEALAAGGRCWQATAYGSVSGGHPWTMALRAVVDPCILKPLAQTSASLLEAAAASRYASIPSVLSAGASQISLPRLLPHLDELLTAEAAEYSPHAFRTSTSITLLVTSTQ